MGYRDSITSRGYRTDKLLPAPAFMPQAHGTSLAYGMEYPNQLKIGAHTIQVVIAESWEGSEACDYGEFVKEKGTIYIKEGLPPSLLLSTLVHEVFHVINSTLDHALLDSLSEQVAQVLWDNKLI